MAVARTNPAPAPAKKPVERGSALSRARARWAWAMLTLPLLFFVIVRLVPTLYAMRMSFYDWKIIADTHPWVGLANYTKLFKDPNFLQSLRNTFIYVVVGVPLQLALGLAVALAIQSINRFQGFFRFLYFLPYVTSSIAVGWVWRWMLQEHGGLVNEFLHLFGIPAQKFLGSPTQAIYCIIMAIVWQGLGFSMVIFLAGLEAVPDSFYEAAALDGASGWTRFRYITLPLINPTIVFSAIVGTIRYLQVFSEVYSMSSQGAGGPLGTTKTLVLFIYEEAFKSFKMGYASAATVVLFVIIMLLTLLQSRVITRRVDY